jgi:hypothetical protein
VNLISAIEMAEAAGIPEKRFRQALREAALAWHAHGAPWLVEIGSPEHADMQAVLQRLAPSHTPARPRRPGPSVSRQRDLSDEAYIIGLCDDALGQQAKRQHRFDFLRGDPGRHGQGVMLPVDAWYPELKLVVEYRERQHTEEVPFFDRKPTLSGTGRGEQRRLYDQRRRDILPDQGIALVEFDCREFQCTASGRLVRCDADRQVVMGKLQPFKR